MKPADHASSLEVHYRWCVSGCDEAPPTDFACRTLSRRVNRLGMIVILGCDHCLQLPLYTTGLFAAVEQTKRAQTRRQGFRAKVVQLTATHGCTYIGEETNQGQLTPAGEIAQQQGLDYHDDIDMPPEQRAAQGIPPGYDESPNYTHALKHGWDQLREQYMFDQVQASRGAHQSLLIICGVKHMVPLCNRFSNLEPAMTVDVTQEAWFSGPLHTDWLNE